MRRGVVTSLVASLAAVLLAGPASAESGWHRVDEPWHRYEQSGLLLPADRYCGDFDMSTTPLFQDIRSRVVSRWDSGGPRETVYAGPLRAESTNEATGESVVLNLSGRAELVQREDGSLQSYESKGPIGMGFPVASIGLEPGFYLFQGRHVVEFPEGQPRRLVVDQGTETNVCDLVR